MRDFCHACDIHMGNWLRGQIRKKNLFECWISQSALLKLYSIFKFDRKYFLMEFYEISTFLRSPEKNADARGAEI